MTDSVFIVYIVLKCDIGEIIVNWYLHVMWHFNTFIRNSWLFLCLEAHFYCHNVTQWKCVDRSPCLYFACANPCAMHFRWQRSGLTELHRRVLHTHLTSNSSSICPFPVGFHWWSEIQLWRIRPCPHCISSYLMLHCEQSSFLACIEGWPLAVSSVGGLFDCKTIKKCKATTWQPHTTP